MKEHGGLEKPIVTARIGSSTLTSGALPTLRSALWSSGETMESPLYSKMVIVDPLPTENVASVHLAGRVTVPMSR